MTHKVREILQVISHLFVIRFLNFIHIYFKAACINMRHGKRKHMTGDDINAVFKKFQIEPIYGASAPLIREAVSILYYIIICLVSHAWHV